MGLSLHINKYTFFTPIINCNFRDRMWKFCSCRRWFDTNNNIHLLIYTAFYEFALIICYHRNIKCACNRVSSIGFWNCCNLTQPLPCSPFCFPSEYLSIDFQISAAATHSPRSNHFFADLRHVYRAIAEIAGILTIHNIHSELLIYAGIRRTPHKRRWNSQLTSGPGGYARLANAL